MIRYYDEMNSQPKWTNHIKEATSGPIRSVLILFSSRVRFALLVSRDVAITTCASTSLLTDSSSFIRHPLRTVVPPPLHPFVVVVWPVCLGPAHWCQVSLLTTFHADGSTYTIGGQVFRRHGLHALEVFQARLAMALDAGVVARWAHQVIFKLAARQASEFGVHFRFGVVVWGG